MAKGWLLCTGMEIGVEAVMGVGSIEEEPGTGWEYVFTMNATATESQ